MLSHRTPCFRPQTFRSSDTTETEQAEKGSSHKNTTKHIHLPIDTKFRKEWLLTRHVLNLLIAKHQNVQKHDNSHLRFGVLIEEKASIVDIPL